ncbi:MAG: hypothetical protein HC765_10955 [Brachymonas sp.]|nr:hypothetical protein [Brachymonas sp.]
MSIDRIVFQTFRKLGAPDEDAAQFADEIHAAIDRRYELHAKQLSTRGDLETAKAEIIKELSKQMADLQRWTVTTIIAALAFVVAAIKLF